MGVSSMTLHKKLLLICITTYFSCTSKTSSTTTFVTKENDKLYVRNEAGVQEEFKFSGVNIFWLGQDHSDIEVPYGENIIYSNPSKFRIDDVLESAHSMGAKVIRTYFGISTGKGEYHAYNMGWNGTIWPELGGVGAADDAFESADYALFKAASLGLRLIVPLTNEWNYAAGGINDFLAWREKSELEGVDGNCVCNMDQHKQDAFFTDPLIIQDFRNYVSHILSHVNKYSGIAYKDDPTILAWETGNELYFPPLEWSINFAKYLKADLKAQQLVMDGRHVSASGIYPELESESLKEDYRNNIDIVSDHFYPMNVDSLIEFALFAGDIGLPAIIGEIGWTDDEQVSALDFLTLVEQFSEDGLISGDLFWSMYGHAETYGHVTHDDGFSIYWPTGPAPESFHFNNPAYKTMMKNFSDHMFHMSGNLIPTSYALSSSQPEITYLECKVGQWVQIAFRGVAGAHLYKVLVDDVALAFIEDRQRGPTYIHNQVVQEGSVVHVIPYGYGEVFVEGTPSATIPCSFN